MLKNLNAYFLHDKVRLTGASVREAVTDGITAVYFEGTADVPLDADHGAEITFDVGVIDSYMADHRWCPFWCAPYFGTDLSLVPDETQGLIIKYPGDRYAVILPLVSEQYKCVLYGTPSGVSAKLFSRFDGLTECKAPAFLYAEGEDPFLLLKNTAELGIRIAGNDCKLREERVYPELFEYLGWCSWDAMEIRVNHDDLVKKCAEFKAKDIPVKWLIIDDMWEEVRAFHGARYSTRGEMFQLMHSSRLYTHKADPLRFPKGLKACIRDINDYGVEVGLWHPATGYWKGLEPDGECYREYRDFLITTPDGLIVHDYRSEKAYAYYNALHTYFRECGAKFVKIDNQSGLTLHYNKIAPIGTVVREYHSAIEASVSKHFDGRLINCMGMSSEDMWNRSDSPISRCSDDFQPDNKAWFSNHITMCAYNDLIQGQLYYCDWDMWWTGDGQAKKNSVLRAVSGGPVYISDKLGESVADVLRPLILKDGRILRCDNPAVPTKDCLTENPVTSGKIFKIQNLCGAYGVLAVFNINETDSAVAGTISPSDITGLPGDRFAVYEHFSKTCAIMDKQDVMALSLENNDDFRLYIFAPYKDGFAAIGLTDKFISPKTIRAQSGRRLLLYESGEYAVVEDGKLTFRNA